MKIGDIIGTAIASTFRSKLRTSLTVIAIFIGAFTLTLTSAIGTGVSTYINTQVASIGANNILTVTKTAASATATGSGPAKYDASTASGTVQGATRGAPTTTSLTAADITKIRHVAGITQVTPSDRVAPDYIEYGSHGKYVVTVNTNSQFTKADLAAGAQLTNTGSAHQVVLPTTYLHNLGFASAKAAIGESVRFGITDYLGTQHTVTATVVGIQNATLFGSDASVNSALRDALVADQDLGRPAAVTTSYASATAVYATGTSTAKVNDIKRALTAAGFTGQTVADQLGTLTTVINGIVGVLDAFAVIALLAAAFGIVNTLLMSVQERTREIGLMKAMGMGGGRIYALFSFEAIFIGFLGSAIGAGIAIGIGTVISRVLSRHVLSGLPGLNLLLFSPTSVVTIILVVMAIAFLAGTLPARRASRLDPIEALRYE